MRTVQFSTILNEAIQLCGLDRDNINTKTFKAFRDFASNRLNEIWNREQWPFLVKFENTLSGREVTQIQTFAGSPLVTFTTPYQIWDYESKNYNGSPALISVDTTIANKKLGAPLISGSFAYSSFPTVNSVIINTGVNQASSATYNLSPDTIASLSSKSDTSYSVRLPSDCETVLGIYTNDPRATTKAIDVGFYLESLQGPLTGGLFSTWYDYAVLKEQINCWVQYRVSCPKLTGDAWVNGVGYDAGSQVYYLGEFWNALIYAEDVAPIASENSIFWQKVAIPELFRAFLVRAIMSDYLRSESQFDQAGAAEIEAQMAYDRAVDFVLRQEQQSGKLNMLFTY